MRTPAAPSSGRTKAASERKIAKLFGLEGDNWLRHANPLAFGKPRSTRNWASKGVLGEHVWSDRDKVEIPQQFRSRVPNVTAACQVVGLAVLAYGLVELDLLAVVSGLVIVQTAKAWFIDRQVLLYEDMKTRNPEYAEWEY